LKRGLTFYPQPGCTAPKLRGKLLLPFFIFFSAARNLFLFNFIYQENYIQL